MGIIKHDDTPPVSSPPAEGCLPTRVVCVSSTCDLHKVLTISILEPEIFPVHGRRPRCLSRGDLWSGYHSESEPSCLTATGSC